MNRIRKVDVILLLILSCLPFFGEAQFVYKASLSSVQQTGFHQIEITPAVFAKCNANLSDLRIVDANKKFIPYILNKEQPNNIKGGFQEFPILSNSRIRDSVSEIIIESKSTHLLPGLALVIKNASVYRPATVSGSNDKQDWYIIKDVMLQGNPSATASEYIQEIELPPGNYKFYKIIIHDKGSLPLKIVSAGMLTSHIEYGNYSNVPEPVVTQKDSNAHSYVTLAFNDEYLIHKLTLQIIDPLLYKRSVSIFDTLRGGKKFNNYHTILAPKESIVLPRAFKTRHVLIDIVNKDDAPLKIVSATAYQLRQYVVARLEKGKRYELRMGDAKAVTPEYDLNYFAGNLNIVKEEVKVDAVEKAGPAAAVPIKKTNGLSSIWLWMSLGLVLILLILLSMKLIKEIPKK